MIKLDMVRELESTEIENQVIGDDIKSIIN